MQRVSDDELMDRLDHGRDELVDDPVILVECTRPGTADPAALGGRFAGLPAILIGTGATPGHSLADAMDVIATDAAEIGRFEDAITHHREAAISLALLLRGGRDRSVAEGLVAESTTYSMLQAGPDHRHWLDNRPVQAPTRAETDDVLQLRRDGKHLYITLNRPDTRNAFNAAMRDALLEAFAVLAADESLTATLDAKGPSFCSGGDLREFGTIEDPATAHLLRVRRNVGWALAEVAERVTVRVRGHCIGAGVELPAFAALVERDRGGHVLPT